MGDSRDHFESHERCLGNVPPGAGRTQEARDRSHGTPSAANASPKPSKDKQTDEYTGQRLRELAEFFGTTTAWYGLVRQWPAGALTKFVKAGDKIRRVIGLGA